MINNIINDVYLFLGGLMWVPFSVVELWVLVSVVELWSLVEDPVEWLTNQQKSADEVHTQVQV